MKLRLAQVAGLGGNALNAISSGMQRSATDVKGMGVPNAMVIELDRKG